MKEKEALNLFEQLKIVLKPDTYLEKRIYAGSNNKFYYYHAPDIVLTEKIRKDYHEFDTERMGAYFSNSLCNIGSVSNEYIKYGEGYIVLYLSSISECAGMLAEATKGDVNEYNDALAKIVLIHELFHWMVYEYPSFLTHSYFTKTYSTIETSTFHESIAQYYTYLKIKQLKDEFLMKVFDELTERQAPKYSDLKVNFWHLEHFVNLAA
jgi:hypothetical protein